MTQCTSMYHMIKFTPHSLFTNVYKIQFRTTQDMRNQGYS